MNKIHASIDLDSASGNKLDDILPIINKAFARAVKVVNSKLKNINNGYDINVVFKHDPENTISEE